MQSGSLPTETMTLEVNGATCQVECRPDTPLLYVLRNDLGLKAARFGCGLGQCGACFVLVDGHPAASCDLPVRSAVGLAIVTVEGLVRSGELGALYRSFVREQAAQCGYCMSGILISATALLRTSPTPTDADVCAALDRHLCRCGSHRRVVRAVVGAGEATT